MSIPVFLSCTTDGFYNSGNAVFPPMSYLVDVGIENGFSTPKDYYFACLIHCFLGMKGTLQVTGTCTNPLFNLPTTTTITTLPATTTVSTAVSTSGGGVTTTPSKGALSVSPAGGVVMAAGVAFWAMLIL
jgi:hypothetical protein